MGLPRLVCLLAATALLQFCGAEDEAAPSEPGVISFAGAEPSADVQVELDAVPPQYGGTVVVAGAHPVEVLPYEDGTIDAYVRSPEPPPPAQTQITVRVPADDGETHPVLLVWDPSQDRYRGHLRRVHPAPGPVEVVIVGNGQRYRGSGPRVVVVGPAPPAPVVVVEAPREPSTAVVVERPSPRVEVEVRRPAPPRPRVQIHVDTPRPRHDVVIHGPGPRRPSVRMKHRGRRVRARGGRGRPGGRGRVRVRRR